MRNMIPHSKPWITDQDRDAVQQLLLTGMLSDGNTVKNFEESLSMHLGCPKVHVCNSGTAALYLALASLQLQKEEQVILPTYVCSEVYQAVKLAGATPVLCDVGPHWNMTPETVEPHITKNTKAIILVNIFGIAQFPTEYRKFGITLINDLCQNFDEASNKSSISNDLGDFLIFSFHATKCLTSGKGGAVCATNEEMRYLLHKKWTDNDNLLGITDLQAALGHSQLTRYGQFQKKRKEIINLYCEQLPGDLLHSIESVRDHWNGYRFLLRHEHLNVRRYIEELALNKIIARRGVDTLLHRTIGLKDNQFINAIKCYNQTVSIPCYPALSEEEQKHIVEHCKKLEKLV